MNIGGASTLLAARAVRKAGRGGQETDPPKIDVSRYVREMEEVLHSQEDPVRRGNAIAILLRWQFDEMLDYASRAKARMLVQKFGIALRSDDTVHYGRWSPAGERGRRS